MNTLSEINKRNKEAAKKYAVSQFGYEVFKPMVTIVSNKSELALKQSIELFTWLRDNKRLPSDKRLFKGSFSTDGMPSRCPLCDASNQKCGECLMFGRWPTVDKDLTKYCMDRSSLYFHLGNPFKMLSYYDTMIDALKKRLKEIQYGDDPL